MTPHRPSLAPYLLRFAAAYSAFLLVAAVIVAALDLMKRAIDGAIKRSACFDARGAA